MSKRIVGVVALVLGTAGSVLAIAAIAVMAWFGIKAGNTVDDIVADINDAAARLDDRLAQAEDLIDEPQRDAELRARLDGVADASRNTRLSVDVVEDHPLYSLLPSRFSRLADTLAEIDASAQRLTTAATDQVEERLTALRSTVSRLDAEISDAGASLRRWIRVAALVLVLIGLWSLWSQVTLARDGWRRVRHRGQPS